MFNRRSARTSAKQHIRLFERGTGSPPKTMDVPSRDKCRSSARRVSPSVVSRRRQRPASRLSAAGNLEFVFFQRLNVAQLTCHRSGVCLVCHKNIV
ncbi:Uncharacterized protein FWK35_00034727 [Aphis craccivora]|uniref:Uncharacterized protein n=1 Tax=Aphis craccivora TaxID=307492 RepID=A0A6G0VXB9_APHCR|nr:Uncharacterized protein FWK35_00034727 [Aphis craccivora]